MEYFHGHLNSFKMRLPGEHTIARKRETIFAPLPAKQPLPKTPTAGGM